MTTEGQFDQAMADCLDLSDSPPCFSKVAVACSGGPDSMALTLLLRDWAVAHNVALVALIVDHGLRPTSKDEADKTKERLGTYGIDAVILSGQGCRISQNIQAEARALRYRLMMNWLKENGVGHLVLAHHQDDQAETFLLRLARGSGVKGLSAMRKREKRDGIILLRPLLSWSKIDLRAVLDFQACDFVEDPSNHNEAFDRVRVRKNATMLKNIGLTPEKLSQTADRLGRIDAFIDRLSDTYTRQHTRAWGLGFLRVDRKSFADLDPEVALRCLQKWFPLLNGGAFAPRASKTELLLTRLQGNEASFKCELAHCRIQMRKREFFIYLLRKNTETLEKHDFPGFKPLESAFEKTTYNIEPAGDSWRTVLKNDTGFVPSPDLPVELVKSLPVLRKDGQRRFWPLTVDNRLIWSENGLEIAIRSNLQEYYGE